MVVAGKTVAVGGPFRGWWRTIGVVSGVVSFFGGGGSANGVGWRGSRTGSCSLRRHNRRDYRDGSRGVCAEGWNGFGYRTFTINTPAPTNSHWIWHASFAKHKSCPLALEECYATYRIRLLRHLD